MGNVIEATDATFEAEVLKAQQPVLVDFWGPGCPPCLRMAPVVEQLAEENAGLKVVKVNVAEGSDTAGGYGVTGIPTFMIFKKGEVVDRYIGLQPKNRLQEAIDQALS
jgi:thioredoxin 1